MAARLQSSAHVGRRVVVGLSLLALAKTWLAFAAGDFEHPVDHDIGRPPTDWGLDKALQISLFLVAAVLLAGFWPKLVRRYRENWHER
jgi:hypothetical protein